jgi:hypothetical protein
MRFLEIGILVVIGIFLASGAQADIYRWVDQTGVVHFSNYSPAEGAKVVIKETNEPARQRSAVGDPETVSDVVLAARQEMERVLQEDRLREMNRKLDELLSRSEEAEARLAAAEASAAQARDLAQDAISERRNDYGPDVIYVTRPTYVPDYPPFFSDSCLGYGVAGFPLAFSSSYFVSPFIHSDRFSRFRHHRFGSHLSFNTRFDGLAHHGRFSTIPSVSHFHTAIGHGSRGSYRGRGRW